MKNKSFIDIFIHIIILVLSISSVVILICLAMLYLHLIDEYLGGGRKIFLITGKEIGKGKDNEPLLKNINILKEIEL